MFSIILKRYRRSGSDDAYDIGEKIEAIVRQVLQSHTVPSGECISFDYERSGHFSRSRYDYVLIIDHEDTERAYKFRPRFTPEIRSRVADLLAIETRQLYLWYRLHHVAGAT